MASRGGGDEIGQEVSPWAATSLCDLHSGDQPLVPRGHAGHRIGPCHHREEIEGNVASLHSCCLLWASQSFHFPLFMTMLHLAVIFLFSALSRALVQCSSHRARVVLSWTDYLRRVAPTGRSSVGRAAGEPRIESRGPCGHTLPTSSPPHLSPTARSQQSRQLPLSGSCPCPCWLTWASSGLHQTQNGGASPCNHAKLG